MEKIAAIDIGSNAVRFTTADLEHTDKILTDEKIRVPLRLGTQAFSNGQTFSKEFIDYAQTTFHEIKNTLKEFKVTRCRTVATSALRDAKNSQELVDAVYKASGIKINIISGDTEARLILKAIQNSSEIKDDSDYLLFDLGGGSLELSLIEKGKMMGSKSFNLGTVRMLEYIKKHGDKKDIDSWLDFKLEKISEFLDKEIKASKNLNVIGTGGNFRRLTKLRLSLLNKKPKYVAPEEIKEILNLLEKTSFLERIEKYDLRPDRADIIIPAIKVISKVVDMLPVNKVFAPSIGLIQGVLLDMSDGKTDSDQLL
jgi:exopolyphosphatase/guanosine-5'-triphosphate,3'-diphosphate pyrophosphatase